MSQQQLFDTDLAKRHPLSILLVDDNFINLKVVASMLLKMGYEVDQATNGVEALEAQRRAGYDLILMDIQMPRMDGVTATKHIIEDYPAEDRPRIVAVTAHAMKGDRERYLAAGMDGYISKPVRVDSLVEAIEQTPYKGSPASLEPSSPAGGQLPINIGMFAEMLGMTHAEATELLPELIGLFVEDSAEQLPIMATAIATGNHDRLLNAAHKMKGGAASIAAVPLSEACAKLEKEGSEQADQAFILIQTEVERLKSWLESV